MRHEFFESVSYKVNTDDITNIKSKVQKCPKSSIIIQFPQLSQSYQFLILQIWDCDHILKGIYINFLFISLHFIFFQTSKQRLKYFFAPLAIIAICILKSKFMKKVNLCANLILNYFSIPPPFPWHRVHVIHCYPGNRLAFRESSISFFFVVDQFSEDGKAAPK